MSQTTLPTNPRAARRKGRRPQPGLTAGFRRAGRPIPHPPVGWAAAARRGDGHRPRSGPYAVTFTGTRCREPSALAEAPHYRQPMSTVSR